MENFYKNQNNFSNSGPTALNSGTYSTNNFSKAFMPMQTVPTNGYNPKSMFSHHNFINSGELMHNNLSQILLNEEIREYSVMIDSKDRNYQVYPDPFSYDVKFNPLPAKAETLNGKTTIYEDPTPTINENFKNVRYIKLESIILPFYTQVRQVDSLNSDEEIVTDWNVNVSKNLTDNLYTVLSLGEYTDTNYRSTNDVLADSFATIYYSHKINNSHFKGQTSNGIKIFPQDNLGKIDKLKISFTDPYGNLLRCPHVDKNIRSNLCCQCISPNGDADTDCFEHNLFHPLNPFFQHHIHLKVGVLEPRLNKMNFN